MRPRNLDEILGQEALLAPGAALRALLDAGELPSLILWGPPGSGKTTLARVIARDPRTRFEPLSAVMAGVKEIRSVVERAKRERAAGHRTILFLDELHRLNRAQQDALLPHVEAGTVTLIGATTENPSFEVIAPLLSRCRVFALERLSDAALIAILRRAVADPERGLGRTGLVVPDEVIGALAHAADADARRALGLLETAAAIHRQTAAPDAPLSTEAVREAVGRRLLLHDRDREQHYDVVSALIKSLRASDPDAALYYAARMLAAGEDPRFVARRLVIFASEDIGNAEPAALGVATSAYLAVERIGMPEGRIPLAQAVTFLACAPKSNASYVAINRAWEAAESRGSLPVPLHLRNAPTALMREMGYGAGYEYPHDAPEGFVAARNLPEALGDPVFYEPKAEGAEADIAERLAALRHRRARARKPGD
ncbi:MAG TPA: replication-associated recombination protein A [Myxococcota bacterium]